MRIGDYLMTSQTVGAKWDARGLRTIAHSSTLALAKLRWPMAMLDSGTL